MLEFGAQCKHLRKASGGGGGHQKEERTMKSPRWGYVRIISGTIFGGILGFYLMHRAELKYKVLRSAFFCIYLVVYPNRNHMCKLLLYD